MSKKAIEFKQKNLLLFILVFLSFSCKKENVNYISSDDLAPWSLYASSSSTDLNLFPILEEDIFMNRVDLIKYQREGLVEINKPNFKFSGYVTSPQSSPILLLNENGQEYFTWNNRNIFFDSSIVELISSDEVIIKFANLTNQLTNTNTNTSTSTNTASSVISNSWELHFFK
tara:strand:- start:1567 stop:2082 length:516 start_codon:yes stop_codon:yes gene_type:complete